MFEVFRCRTTYTQKITFCNEFSALHLFKELDNGKKVDFIDPVRLLNAYKGVKI